MNEMVGNAKLRASIADVSKKQRLPPPELMDKTLERRPARTWLWLTISIIGIAVASWLFLKVIASNKIYVIPVSRASLSIMTVKRGAFQPAVATVAQIQPAEEYFIENKDAGRVEKVFVQPGESVQRGDSIVQLTNTDILLSVLKLETDVAEQINNLSTLEIVYNKTKLEYDLEITRISYEFSEVVEQLKLQGPLLKQKFVNASLVDQLRRERDYKQGLLILRQKWRDLELAERMAQINTARKIVDDMRSNLDIAKKSLDDLLIKAEIDGTLASLDVKLGQFKARGAALGRVYFMGQPKVIVLLDEFYLSRLSVGTKAEFKTKEGILYFLSLTKILPEVEAGKVKLEFKFDVEPPQEFISSQSIDIRISTGASSQDTVLLPNGEFIGKTGGRWVFVVTPDMKKAVRRNITIGERSAEQIEVLEDIEPGEQVITSSYRELAEANELNIGE
ncbi:HlyD family efflux transporter periplasmic adaptor subunit [Serratia fonticola]|uniref:efflux RND transporter periplasmic adaptor subunit n=1 Tax=Serratia fonticola TaxID=47917 RepID=UPI003AAA22DA